MEMIIKRQQELRKNRKKGFTLVELIVVIVILAILAAIAVPALTGYIDKARSQGLESQAHTAVVAAQAATSDAYVSGNLRLPDGSDPTGGPVLVGAATSAQWVQVINAYVGSPAFVVGPVTTGTDTGVVVTITAGALDTVVVSNSTGSVSYDAATGVYS